MPATPRLLAALIAVGLSITACSDGGATSTATAAREPPGQSSAAARAVQLDPAGFAAVVAGDDTFVVNVHVPDEGSIAGTDIAVPYDEIRMRVGELPADRQAPLAVYCRSGRMSTEAVITLHELGYTDVVELRGGMEAWTADGRELLPPSA